MSHYLVHRPAIGATPSLGAISLNANNIDDVAARIAGRVSTAVTERVTTDVSRALERGVERMTASAGVGLDRFLDSPAGAALFSKIEDKVDLVATNTIKKHQIELALLGIAGLSFFMGGSNLAGRIGPRGTRVAFAVGGLALVIVASGVFAPPEEVPLSPPSPPVRRVPVR